MQKFVPIPGPLYCERIDKLASLLGWQGFTYRIDVTSAPQTDLICCGYWESTRGSTSLAIFPRSTTALFTVEDIGKWPVLFDEFYAFVYSKVSPLKVGPVTFKLGDSTELNELATLLSPLLAHRHFKTKKLLQAFIELHPDCLISDSNPISRYYVVQDNSLIPTKHKLVFPSDPIELQSK